MEYSDYSGNDLSYIDLSNKETLVVEDLMSNYLLLETVLENLGTHITWAQNGAEAVDFIKKKKFDVILMDLKMPIMDGFTATKKIKEMNIDTPIIAVTAYVFDSDREKAIEAGCTDYISKPIDKDELIETIGKALKIL